MTKKFDWASIVTRLTDAGIGATATFSFEEKCMLRNLWLGFHEAIQIDEKTRNFVDGLDSLLRETKRADIPTRIVAETLARHRYSTPCPTHSPY